MLTTASECREYVFSHTPEEIAVHLRHDQRLCIAGRLPSILALYLPYKSPLADAIAGCLVHAQKKEIRTFQYRGVLRTIRAFLYDFEPGKNISGTDAKLLSPEVRAIPTTQEFETTFKVLEYLEKVPATNVTAATQLADVFTAVSLYIALDPELRAAYGSIPARPESSVRTPGKGGYIRSSQGTLFRKCYMCNYIITKPHSQYQSLCIPCGSFNLQQSVLSLPQNLNLTHKRALVTGGRVNLGFNIALRLLRCGAQVIVSSRYPLDTETRYRAEPDFHAWQNKIRVIGADFRTARDAFALVAAAKGVLTEWAREGITGPEDVKLDVLVNNAAQTLTDSLQKEEVAVRREEKLQSDFGVGVLQATSEQGYQARVRVGEEETKMFIGLPSADEQADLGNEGPAIGKSMVLEESAPAQALPGSDKGKTKALHESTPGQTLPIATISVRQETSWTQTLNQIPYEDVITAQAVNAFVPLILIRELLPLMGSPRPSNDVPEAKAATTTKRPLGYIINISSREGLSELRPTSSVKNGHHVHTNMSKAALNMLTETEAAPAWHSRRVAMNSVDPGFMSAADGSECPIGWEDGAARALWCVAKGETEGMDIWGRFLKHFGGVGALVRHL